MEVGRREENGGTSATGSACTQLTYAGQLTAENAPDDIIAYVKDEPPVFALMVKPAAEGNLDEIILVFAILEQHLRLGVKALRVADGWGADERSTITGTPLR